jgi:hypothetical protein
MRFKTKHKSKIRRYLSKRKKISRRSRNKIVLYDYKNYWVSSIPDGHLIEICHGKTDIVLEIECKWKNRYRDKGSNRVRNND